MSKVEASQLVSYLRNLRCNKNLSAQQFENIDPSVHDQFVRCLKTEKLDETPIRISYNSHLRILKFQMPGQLHDACGGWLNQCFMLWAANQQLPGSWLTDGRPITNPTITGFTGNFVDSSKEPDGGYKPTNAHQPSLVLECGVSESLSELRNDKDLWLSGPEVCIVILVKFTHIAGTERVKGFLEVWRRGDIHPKSYDIFPIPTQQGFLTLTVAELYNNTQNQTYRESVLALDISVLRYHATEALNGLGLRPAT